MIDIQNTPFKVVSYSELDGTQIDHFMSRDEAERFAKAVAEESYSAMVCEVLNRYMPEEVKAEEPARAGVDYPCTLGPRKAA